jgi:Kef-type K+ transport system membrane component KefB
MALGTGVAMLLDIDPRPALLIGSFWASFTLIAYPTVARYGLTRTRPVAAIVGASAITDGVSLVVLALIVGAETGEASGARLVFDIALGFAVLGVYCFVVVPAVARWFFTGSVRNGPCGTCWCSSASPRRPWSPSWSGPCCGSTGRCPPD